MAKRILTSPEARETEPAAKKQKFTLCPRAISIRLAPKTENFRFRP